MQNEFEKAYTSKEVSDHLKIATVTLRKWCLQLERDGYHIGRDDNGRRFYVESDLLALKNFKKYLANDMTMENASQAVIARFPRDDEPERTLVVPEQLQRYDERYDELLRSNVELMKRMDDLKDYIDISLRARDEQLLTAIREIQETKQLAAAAQDNKKWWKFWK